MNQNQLNMKKHCIPLILFNLLVFPNSVFAQHVLSSAYLKCNSSYSNEKLEFTEGTDGNFFNSKVSIIIPVDDDKKMESIRNELKNYGVIWIRYHRKDKTIMAKNKFWSTGSEFIVSYPKLPPGNWDIEIINLSSGLRTKTFKIRSQ